MSDVYDNKSKTGMGMNYIVLNSIPTGTSLKAQGFVHSDTMDVELEGSCIPRAPHTSSGFRV